MPEKISSKKPRRENKLLAVKIKKDIPAAYRNTPIGLLVEYHNLRRNHDVYTKAQLLIGMCMDHRKQLHIPDKFAYILRTGGANLRYSEFKVSYAIAVGDVRHIALIGHSQCGMVNLVSKKDTFIQGLIDNAGWKRKSAEEHFLNFAPLFEIENEVDFILSEVKRLRIKYPKVKIAPLIYKIEDNLFYFIKEK